MLSSLEYPYKSPPAEGDWLEVASGIFWLRLPLPLALNHVHAWVLRDGDGWFVIDSGFGGKRMQALWDKIIAEKLDGKPITRLLVTHFHPDHVGSAGYLWQKFQPQLLMTKIEWLTARMLALDIGYSVRDVAAAHYRAMGVADDMTAQLTGGNRYAAAVTLPPPTLTPIKNGDTLSIDGDRWQIITGGGHSPEQVSLYSPARDIYISADQILPRISPNVSVWATNPAEDALAQYLAALDDTRTRVPDSAFVLPSHDLPFRNLHARIDQLKHHHDERLEQILDLSRARPHTVAEITTEAFSRPLDSIQMGFAIGEMLAHANYLQNLGKLRRDIDADGVWKFTTI